MALTTAASSPPASPGCAQRLNIGRWSSSCCRQVYIVALQRAVEALTGRSLHKQNFRRPERAERGSSSRRQHRRETAAARPSCSASAAGRAAREAAPRRADSATVARGFRAPLAARLQRRGKRARYALCSRSSQSVNRVALAAQESKRIML